VTYLEVGYRHVLPWFLPGTALFVLAGVLAARPFARWLPTHPIVAWGLVVSFGIVVSATLTPLRGHFNFAATGGTCDLSRIGLAPLDDLSEINDTTLNILMFIPLGIGLGLLGRSRRATLLIVAALALPVAIETTQLLIPAIERGCQSADVFDNLTGLVIGLGIGALASILAAILSGD
jgi:glycopeptide antibiotics resistance protein